MGDKDGYPKQEFYKNKHTNKPFFFAHCTPNVFS